MGQAPVCSLARLVCTELHQESGEFLCHGRLFVKNDPIPAATVYQRKRALGEMCSVIAESRDTESVERLAIGFL